jgi:hypothetical protein
MEAGQHLAGPAFPGMMLAGWELPFPGESMTAPRSCSEHHATRNEAACASVRVGTGTIGRYLILVPFAPEYRHHPVSFVRPQPAHRVLPRPG